MNHSSVNPRTPAVLVDLDGTLVDVSKIRHIVQGPKRDFDAFHRASVDCPPVPETLLLIENYRKLGNLIVVVSSRSNKFRSLTNMWLALHSIEVDLVLMRKEHDARQDILVKTEMFEHLKDRYELVAAIDDRQDLLENWGSLGVPELHLINLEA